MEQTNSRIPLLPLGLGDSKPGAPVLPQGVLKRLQQFSLTGHRPRVYTCGSFDLMNHGTVALFKSIKTLVPDCELMVGCYSDQDINDQKGMNVLYESERIKGLQFCKYVDLIYFPAPWIHEFEFFEENEIDFVTGEINGWDLDLLTFEDGEIAEYIQHKQPATQRKVAEEGNPTENPSAGLAASLKLKIYANSKFNYLKKMILSLPSERETLVAEPHHMELGMIDEDLMPIRRNAGSESPELLRREINKIEQATESPLLKKGEDSGSASGLPKQSSTSSKAKADPGEIVPRKLSDTISALSNERPNLKSAQSAMSQRVSGNFELSKAVHRSQSSVLGDQKTVTICKDKGSHGKQNPNKEHKAVFIEKQSIAHLETAKNLLTELNSHDMYLPINVDGRKGASWSASHTL